MSESSISYLSALDHTDIELDSMPVRHGHTDSDRPYDTKSLKELQPSVENEPEAEQIYTLGKANTKDRPLEGGESDEDSRTLAQDLQVPTPSNFLERSGNLKDQSGNEKGPIPSSSSGENSGGWLYVYNEYKRIDSARIQQMDEYIDTLLTFAGLFSAALTVFLVQVYTELKPDNTQFTAPILLDISRQLHAISLSQVAPVTSVSLLSTNPPKSLVTTTSLWFASLVLVLGAALFGILVKQWLREYMSWVDIYPPMHAIHVREYRNRALEKWRMESIITSISECLEIGLVLFFLGLAVLLWRTNTTTALVTSIFVGLVLLAAFVAVILPTWAWSCPYRISYASFLVPGWIYFLTCLFGFSELVFTIMKLPVQIYNGRGWRESFVEIEFNPLSVERIKSWAHFDALNNLPHGIKENILDRCTSIFWLTNHQTVPENLVIQCLADLPGTSVRAGRPWRSDQTASNQKNARRQQFTVHCQALLSLMRPEDLGADPKKICDLEELLIAMLPDWTGYTFQAPLPPLYEKISVSKLSIALRTADKKSRSVFSAYFITLAKDLLGSKQLLSQDTDFDLVKNLLRILILLWFMSDYQDAQIGQNVESIDVDIDPAAQSFDCLQEVYNRLLAQSEQMTDQESQTCFASIIALLGNDFGRGDDSFLNVLATTSSSENLPNVNPSIFMKFSQRILECNRKEISMDDAGPLDDKRRSKMLGLTQVFWDIAVPIFRSDVENHPNIPAEDCTAFLTAVEKVLLVGVRTGSQYVYYQDWRFRYLPAYVLWHLSHLPDSFVSTLRKADEGEVIDISGMLSQFADNELPDNLQIRDTSAFWSALEPIQSLTDSAPEPESAN